MMIDWFVLLFIAYILLMTVLEEIASHRKLIPYLKQVEPFGIRKGVLFFLGRSISPSTMLLTAWLILQQGIFGGLSLAIIGVVSMSLFSKIYLFIQKRGRYQTHVLKWFSLVTATVSLLMEGAIAGYLFTHVFHLPSGSALYILGVLLFLFTTLGGFPSLQKFSGSLLLIIFISIGTLPIGYYLYGGMSTIYQSLNTQTQMLHVNGTLFNTLIIGIPILLSQLLHQMSFWDHQHAIKKEKTRLILTIVTFCWSSIPLAFTALILYFMAKSPEIHSVRGIVQTMMFDTLPMITYLMVLTWLAFTLLAMSHSLHHITGFIVEWFQRYKRKADDYWVRFAYICGFVVLNITILIDQFAIKNLTTFLYYDALILTSFLVPLLFALLSAKPLLWRPAILAIGLISLGIILLTPYNIETVLVIVNITAFFVWLIAIHFIQSDFSEYS